MIYDQRCVCVYVRAIRIALTQFHRNTQFLLMEAVCLKLFSLQNRDVPSLLQNGHTDDGDTKVFCFIF
jgi:hypothetical protein